MNAHDAWVVLQKLSARAVLNGSRERLFARRWWLASGSVLGEAGRDRIAGVRRAFLSARAPGGARGYSAAKRMLDVTVSGIGLAVTAPVQAVVAGVVRVAHGRPVLYRQQRPGKHGEVFELVKFRTMRQADDTHVTDAERLTRVGRFLRSTSLDELPTLWNVFWGGHESRRTAATARRVPVPLQLGAGAAA